MPDQELASAACFFRRHVEKVVAATRPSATAARPQNINLEDWTAYLIGTETPKCDGAPKGAAHQQDNLTYQALVCPVAFETCMGQNREAPADCAPTSTVKNEDAVCLHSADDLQLLGIFDSAGSGTGHGSAWGDEYREFLVKAGISWKELPLNFAVRGV